MSKAKNSLSLMPLIYLMILPNYAQICLTKLFSFEFNTFSKRLSCLFQFVTFCLFVIYILTNVHLMLVAKTSLHAIECNFFSYLGKKTILKNFLQRISRNFPLIFQNFCPTIM